MDVEIADATGNHWPTFRSYSERMRVEKDRMELRLVGALWPGEDAWKIQIRFRKQSGFSDNALLRFENLGIPLGDEIVRANLVHAANGGRLELVALLGPDATLEQARSIEPESSHAPATLRSFFRDSSSKSKGPSLSWVSMTRMKRKFRSP